MYKDDFTNDEPLKILDSKTREGETLYCIKWKNMLAETWETPDTIKNFEKLLEDYNNRKKNTNSNSALQSYNFLQKKIERIEFEKQHQLQPKKNNKQKKEKVLKQQQQQKKKETNNHLIEYNEQNIITLDQLDTNSPALKSYENELRNEITKRIEKNVKEGKLPNNKIQQEVYKISDDDDDNDSSEEVQAELGIDKPLKVVRIKQNINFPKSLICEIEWMERNNGIKPANSFCSNKEAREYFPNLLLDYYESRIIFPNHKERGNRGNKS